VTSRRRKQAKGATGLAFETWDPCNRSQMKNPPPPLSSRLPRRAVEGFAAHFTLHPSSDRAWSRARPNVLTMSPVG
jgi:hypothetical protein